MLKDSWQTSLEHWLRQVAAQGRGGRMGSRRWVEARQKTSLHLLPSDQGKKEYEPKAERS